MRIPLWRGTARLLGLSGNGAIYESAAAYLDALQASADTAMEAGWLFPEDAETLVAEETARAAAIGLE